MLSPPKRQKTRQSVGAMESGSLGSRNESYPPHPSFQSPTRSSLVRSHSEIAERALSRSPIRRPVSRAGQGQDDSTGESRPSAVGLRERKPLRPSLSGSSPFKASRSADAPVLSPSRRPSGVKSFSKLPRKVSMKIVPSDFTFGTPTRKKIQSTEHFSNTPEAQLALELDSATQDADLGPSLDFGLDDGLMDEDPLEPDLPPTPTQLGLVKAPDRRISTRLSSSPSTRHEKHMKRRATDALQKSPLKLRSQPSDPEESSEDENISRDELSAAALEKRQARKSLKAELQRLRNDVAELTRWAGKIESSEDMERDPKELKKFLTLLSEESSYTDRPVPKQAPVSISSFLAAFLPFSANISRPKRQPSPLPTNPYALKESTQSSEYLTLFAPLAVHTQISQTSASNSRIILETHVLKFTAPSPFPLTTYNVSVVYEANPETQTVVSVSVPNDNDSRKSRIPHALCQWIDSRLANPILKLDVATLCWGINRYWEASVARAQLWARISQNHLDNASSRSAEAAPLDSQAGVMSISELQKLLPHLERSKLVIKSKSSDAPVVLLSNIIALDDWTGEPQLRSELSISTSSNGGSSNKINQEVKKLFHALLHEDGAAITRGEVGGACIDAIFRATEGALGALFGGT
ncbi:hypothetical protein N7495_007102 [Penicillium taxi]|uniref:uncharacterized protein n=1 Tax=Penicillium taxi TaxID=168475 RepID=UPI0025452D47|nr:uncharacterized protein N7495_007102 [Penicillium taxi]KAJ5895411.1 hypothetical protein N7495_007102 [Penicillium taxi]